VTEPIDPLEQISKLIGLHRRELLALARYEGLGAEDALECVQEALCTHITVTGSESLTDEHAAARLKHVVRNAARNARRKHFRAKPHLPIQEENSGEPEREDPEQILSRAEDVVRLRACVAELCSIQRAVVMLRLLEEKSGQDVADEVGLSRSYVDVLLSRARASLKLCMRPNG